MNRRVAQCLHQEQHRAAQLPLNLPRDARGLTLNVMGSESKVTYVTLSADDEPSRAAFASAIDAVKATFGRTTQLFIGGTHRSTSDTTASTSPIDRNIVVGHAASARAQDVQDAIAAAHTAFPAWRATPWETRAELLGKVARLIRHRRHSLAALLMAEMGKNRAEALGEVEETADLINYYNDRMAEAHGFVKPMASLHPADKNTSVLRPYGAWAVIAPWNFPYALLGAPVAAALLMGNTVIAKPSSETPITGATLIDLFIEAGFPAGVVNLITGGGRVLGEALVSDERVAGATFTGSYEVGFHQLYRRFSVTYPRPCIVEMGGKNPALIMDSADVDQAVAGVYRSAFGMNGHKCSACSRVYVHEKVANAFLAKLREKMRATDIGNPLEREVFVGPLATKSSLDDYVRYNALAREAGALLEGGNVLQDGAFAAGYFAQPALLMGLPHDHQLVKEELFVPILSVHKIRTLEEGLALANDTALGLTAGFFSSKQNEIDAFLERIEAGVVYVNRAAGATTGAWPGVQPFGGWKGSGSSGKNIGGIYTLGCYGREQSRTVVG
ncbi:MAG: aldehyde dehydrogenase family protein [Deltaproteobacteria bacterium]|nr:aldehyde dehydrogenase family protein [Deltaproteobacteria bacterium]